MACGRREYSASPCVLLLGWDLRLSCPKLPASPGKRACGAGPHTTKTQILGGAAWLTVSGNVIIFCTIALCGYPFCTLSLISFGCVDSLPPRGSTTHWHLAFFSSWILQTSSCTPVPTMSGSLLRGAGPCRRSASRLGNGKVATDSIQEPPRQQYLPNTVCRMTAVVSANISRRRRRPQSVLRQWHQGGWATECFVTPRFPAPSLIQALPLLP